MSERAKHVLLMAGATVAALLMLEGNRFMGGLMRASGGFTATIIR